MKYYMYTQQKVVGPYLPEEITGLYGGVAPETLICTDAECETGPARWRRITLFPELAGCVKSDISEPLDTPAPAAAADLSLKILSTDDDPNIRALLWHMLTDAGHTVEFAKDGDEVFTRLATKRYDLVVLDVNMPKMNGYKVSELIHSKMAIPPKIIIFTGRDLEKERLQFMCSGADAILSKGTGNEKLIQTIDDLFRKNPEKTPKKAEAPATEPVPQVLEKFSAGLAPAELQKDALSGSDKNKSARIAKAATPFMSEDDTLTPKPTPPSIIKPPAAAPQPAAAIEAAKPAVSDLTPVAGPPAGVPVAAAAAPSGIFRPPTAQNPAAGRETNGKADLVLNKLALENAALRSDLTEIKKVLGRLELQYSQLGTQLEKQASEILSADRETAQKLETDWKNMRRYVSLTALSLLAAVSAVLLLR
ncbi:MAG: response regulator [Elusimicrobiales bacterium]|jgi:CheY-like chemotaxis protein